MKKKIFISLIIFFGIQIFCQQVSYPPYTKTRLKQDVETSTFSIINSYQINATTITIKVILLNGTTITSLISDNLGNHVATTTLNMSGYDIINVSTINVVKTLNVNGDISAIQTKSDIIYTDLIKQKNYNYVEISTGIKVRGYIESDSWVKASSMSVNKIDVSTITTNFVDTKQLIVVGSATIQGDIGSGGNIYAKNVEVETLVKTNKITPYLGDTIDFSYNNFDNVGWVKASSMSLTGDISVSTIVASGNIITNSNITANQLVVLGSATIQGDIGCSGFLYAGGLVSGYSLKANKITPTSGNKIDFGLTNFDYVGYINSNNWIKASSMSLTGDISVSTIVASGNIITNGDINVSGNITTNGNIQCDNIYATSFGGKYPYSSLKINYIYGLTDAYVKNINVSTITFSDGTILTSTKTLGGGNVGDNLGNHIATQNLNMSSYAIVNVSTITFLDGKSMISIPILATVYIAASNAPAKYKAMADYVCDGVADEIEIQNAVNYVNSIGGGKILLSPGTFYFSDGAVINLDNKKNIIIEGESPFSTYIYAPGKWGYPVFGSQTPGVYVENFVIRNVYIYTNIYEWARYPIGIRTYNWQFSRAKNYVAENIICDGYWADFFFWDGENIYLINCEFKDIRYGNRFGVKNGLIKNCKFSAVSNMNEMEFVVLEYIGGSVYPENIIVDGNIFDYSNYTSNTQHQVGVRLNGARNCIVSNNILIYNNTGGRQYNGIYLHYENYNIKIIGNTIINNRVIDSYGNYEAAISLGCNELTYSNYYSSSIIISNNQFVNCTAGIKTYRTSKYNYLMITNNQARDVDIPFAITDRSYIGDNYQFYLNSWETTLDFDKGIAIKSAIFSGDYKVGISTPTATKQMIVDDNYDVWVSTGTNTAWDWIRVDNMKYKTIYRQEGNVELVKEYCGKVDIPANSSVNITLVGATQILDVPIITPKGNYWVNCFVTTVAPTFFTIQNNSLDTVSVGWRAIAK